MHDLILLSSDPDFFECVRFEYSLLLIEQQFRISFKSSALSLFIWADVRDIVTNGKTPRRVLSYETQQQQRPHPALMDENGMLNFYERLLLVMSVKNNKYNSGFDRTISIKTIVILNDDTGAECKTTVIQTTKNNNNTHALTAHSSTFARICCWSHFILDSLQWNQESKNQVLRVKMIYFGGVEICHCNIV